MWCLGEGIGGWTLFGGIWMLVFWGGLIALIIWAITRLTGRGGSTPEHGPLYIAEERYSKGEITRKEFEQFKKDLS